VQCIRAPRWSAGRAIARRRFSDVIDRVVGLRILVARVELECLWDRVDDRRDLGLLGVSLNGAALAAAATTSTTATSFIGR
jgi:hypothetical protein